MTEFIIKRFIRQYKDVANDAVRTRYKLLSDGVILVTSIIIFGIKLFISFITGSKAALADAYLSLADIFSRSIRMIRKKHDREGTNSYEKPGKFSYIVTFILAFVILECAYGLVRSVIPAFLTSSSVKIGIITLLIYLVAVAVKIYQMRFELQVGRKIKSPGLIRASVRGRLDLIFSALVVISFFVRNIFRVNIDALVTMLLLIGVVIRGVRMCTDIIKPALKENVAPETVQKVKEKLLSYPYIRGIYDLHIRHYGRDRILVTAKAEISDQEDLKASRKMLNIVERDAKEVLQMEVILHMMPVNVQNTFVNAADRVLSRLVDTIDSRITFRNLHVINGEDLYNIIFDLIVPYEYSREDMKEVEEKVKKGMQAADPLYNCVFSVERSKKIRII